MSFDIKNLRIGIVGLGYVGLPLAVEFGKKYPTVGFDIHEARVAELEGGTDTTLECSSEELAEAKHLTYTANVDDIADCNFYIVTVPTPIGDGNRPLLTPLRAASNTLGNVIKKGDIVVYESTVYPGATEEFCVPFLETGLGPEDERGLLRRLQPGTHQPGRQGTPPAVDSESDVGVDARSGRLCERGVRVRSSRPARTRHPASRSPKPRR